MNIYSGLIIFFITSLMGQNQEDYFLKANQLYEAQQYTKALSFYESIEDKQAGVWYNMGHCYWYLKNYKDAFCAYKRAFIKGIEASNLSFLNAQIAASYKEWVGHEETQDTFLYACLHYFTLFQWQLIFIGVWILFLLGILLFTKSLFFKVQTLLLMVVMVCLLYPLYVGYKKSGPVSALVTQPTSLFIAPRTDVHSPIDLKLGEGIVVIDALKEWAQVNAQGIVGWVKKSCYELL